MPNRLRLAVVEPNATGGLIHYTYQLCNALANEGVDVTLITGTDYEMSGLPHNFRVMKSLKLWQRFDPSSMSGQPSSGFKRGQRKLYWRVRQGFRAVRFIFAWAKMTAYLIRNRPDVILFTRLQYSFESFFIRILRSRALLLSQICHEFEAREQSKGFFSRFLDLSADVYDQFSMIFFHAQENRRKFLSFFPSIPEEKTHVIEHGNSEWLRLLKAPPGIVEELRDKYALREGDKAILFFGLLAPSKGLEDLIDAFALAHESCNAKLLIVGYPTKHIDMNALAHRIKEKNLSEYVILDTRYIPSDQIGALMRLATFVVYPYRSSTQSGALQVAYTFGKPVLVTAVGGLPEAVEDGKNGFVVPAQSPHDLADKMTLLVNDLELVARMGRYSRHLSETRFSWGSVARDILQAYDRLLGARAGKRSANGLLGNQEHR